MAVDQEIQEAKERVKALRAQVRAESSDRAAASAESSKSVQLAALTEEERHLEEQLESLRSVPVPGETGEGDPNVNVQGGPVRTPQEPLPEGVPFKETVDRSGNLIRIPLEDEEGTQESDAPPPDVPDDATMSGRPQ